MARILKGYRKIGNWENFFLDSAICSIGQSAGVLFDDGLQSIAAATGDLFAYMYSDTEPCDSGYTCYIYEPEAVERAFARMGYGCEVISRAMIECDLTNVLERLRGTIERGIPALAWGCGGVEMLDGTTWTLSEGSLIGGVEEGLLHMHLYPGPERLRQVDEFGYTQIDIQTALAGMQGIFLLGPKQEEQSEREIYENALGLIGRFIAAPKTGTWLFGQAAFARWADILRKEEYWTDTEAVEANSWEKHLSAYCALCTSIGVGGGEGIEAFARKMAYALPDSKRAQQIRPRFERLRALCDAIWSMQGGFSAPAQDFAGRSFREEIARLLEAMGGECAEIAREYA